MISAIISGRSSAAARRTSLMSVAKSACASRSRWSEQGRHRRIEPVAIAQLQRQALLQRAGAYAWRIELLHPGQHGLDLAHWAAEPQRPLRRGSPADSRPRRPGRSDAARSAARCRPADRPGAARSDARARSWAAQARLEIGAFDRRSRCCRRGRSRQCRRSPCRRRQVVARGPAQPSSAGADHRPPGSPLSHQIEAAVELGAAWPFGSRLRHRRPRHRRPRHSLRPSWRSSSGFCSSSLLDIGRRARDSSSCSSLIACCSCGVMTRLWL